jgi:hypothetical protein
LEIGSRKIVAGFKPPASAAVERRDLVDILLFNGALRSVNPDLMSFILLTYILQ